MADRIEQRDTAGVVTLPPLLYLSFLVLGLAIGAAAPVAMLGPDGRTPEIAGGGMLAVAGIALAALAKRRFDAAGTATNPLRPTTAFVVAGPYRWTRNPMYLGMLAAYLGTGLALDNAWVVILAAPLVATIEYGVIRREERYLEQKFGDTYRSYRARVRRWL